MSYSHGAKKDSVQIAILVMIALFIFYPVLYTEYAYTDELVGLWQWNSAGNSPTAGLLQYGRYITGKIGEWLFGSIETIHQLSIIRMVSLLGWIISIPFWYIIIKRIVVKEKLPLILCFFSVLFLICTPTVGISIGWAACFELFLANTLGLVSGYFFYKSLDGGSERFKLSVPLLLLSIAAGVTSLFTYQNGFGCFLLPFLLHFISSSKITQTTWKAVGCYFLIYLVYYLFFKLSLNVSHIDESVRTGLHINVGRKLPFFLARPLGSAFRLTFLANEKNIVGYIVYAIIAGFWIILSWLQQKEIKVFERVKYFFFIFCLFGLMYLPSLVVSENYSSNRTMLALSMAVFFLIAQTTLVALQTERSRLILVTIISLLFVINSWYNFRPNFLNPVKQEYVQLRSFIESNYKAETDTVYFIRPTEDFFQKKYGITRSWDEFGVPSTFFAWTPEFLIKQIIFEKTGNRKAAERIIIRTWIKGDTILPAIKNTNTLLIDATEVLK